MYEVATDGRLINSLLILMLAATCLSAQPPLHLADIFLGVPFTSAGLVTLSADEAYFYTGGSGSGLSVFGREADGEYFNPLGNAAPALVDTFETCP